MRPSSAGRPAAQRAKLEIERPPPPPAGLSPAHATMWAEIAERADTIDKQNYFEMLGASKDAGPDAFRKAYFAQVKKWHPDRVPAELADIKPWAERIFHHLTAAHDTLCDEKKRGRYQSIVADGGGTPESDRKLTAIVQAAMDHQKAEVLLRRRDVAGALALLTGALELSPDDGDIQASYAWALFLQPGKPEVERMSTAIRRAVELNPKSDRAHYYYGMILRRAGKETEALAEFDKAAQLNPKNLDAVRETRLSKMRGTGAAPAPVEKPGAGGVLSKLFGSSKKDK
jgi:curved DNA-binding protein CbpA